MKPEFHYGDERSSVRFLIITGPRDDEAQCAEVGQMKTLITASIVSGIKFMLVSEI